MAPKILIVEDFEKLREALKNFLAGRGYEVTLAPDGIEGLKAYAQTVFDLLILDLRLPRLNGIEVLKKVRQTHRGSKLPVIIISGAYKGEPYREQARKQLGVEHYLEKPFTYDALLKAVQASLKPAETAAAPREAPAAKPAAAPPLRGKLQAKPFDQVLVEVMKKQMSGFLSVARNGEKKTISFLAGAPRWLSLDQGEGNFGQYLLTQGKISLQEYQAYEARRKAAGGQDPTDLFVKMGCLKFEEYHQQLRQWAEDELIGLFGWTEGEYGFQAQAAAAAGPAEINLPRVIHQGFRRHFSPARQGQLYQEVARSYLALAPGFYEHQMLLSLSQAEAVFLDAVDGTKTLLDLTPADPDDSEEVIKGLQTFLVLEMLRLSPEPVSEVPPAPFPIREAAAEAEAAAKAPAVAEEAEGFEDLAGDLSGALTEVVDNLKPAGPAAPVAELKPAAEAPVPAAAEPGASEADQQRRREDELLEFFEKIKDKNYYEIMGMTPQTFDFSRYKSRYFELSKKFSPDKFLMSSGDILAKSEEVLTRLATAFNTLSNVVSKEKYDELLPKKYPVLPGGKAQDKMQAEVAFQSGLAFLEMEDWDGAEKSLAEAAGLDPKNGDALAHLAFATFMKNRRSKTVQVKANELLTRALKLKPQCAAAYAYRGTLLIQEEKYALAEAELSKALRLNPRFRHALKEMKLIEEHKQKEKKGLLGRLRG